MVVPVLPAAGSVNPRLLALAAVPAVWLAVFFVWPTATLLGRADEVLVYPYWETRTLPALTARLEAEGRESFGAMMLDLYPKGPLAAQRYVAMGPAEIQAAFKKWIRPDDLVRVTQGPTPQ